MTRFLWFKRESLRDFPLSFLKYSKNLTCGTGANVSKNVSWVEKITGCVYTPRTESKGIIGQGKTDEVRVQRRRQDFDKYDSSI